MDSRRSFPLEPKLMSSVIAEYKGEYHESCYHGQGYAKFHDGHEYTGTFEGGRLHGNGCFTWADETKYTGEFRNNSVTGTGKYEWTDGSVYEGEVYGGLRHGEGSFQSGTCNARYDGSWERGKRHGNGKLTYDIGRSSYYEGEWFNGCRHGQGKMFYPSGNTYQGEWKNDMKHGHGAMYWLDLNEYYIGSWMNDLQDGQGEHTWKEEPPEMMARIQKQMCNRYIGGFKEGMRHGKGIFYYANGAKYQGEWEKNQKHGRGLFIFEDGSIYSGPFDRDRMVERKIDRAADVVKPKLVLNIYDILPSGKKYDSAKREIDNTILRINTDLKTIYKYYSVGSAASDSTEGSFAMDMRSMRRFVQDCNLKKNSITTAEIDRLFQKVKEMQRREIDKIGIPYEDPTQEVMDIHDSALPILYREFVELVVRIAYAHSIYREGQGHLAHALIELYINNIRDSACKETQDDFQRAFHSASVSSVLQQYRNTMKQLYGKFATIHAEPNDSTMSIRGWVSLLKEKGIIGRSLSISQAANLLLLSDEREENEKLDLFVLDYELVYSEFQEALARIADTTIDHVLPLHVKLDQFLKTALTKII